MLQTEITKKRNAFRTTAEKIDVYNKFKIFCIEQNMSVREGLERAMRMFIKDYNKKKK